VKEKMNSKNILVTGGSGKIDRAVPPELLKTGFYVRTVEFEDSVGYEVWK